MTLSPADRLDILDLLTRADDAASARDIEGYLSLLTSDMVLDGDQGTYRGTSALRNALAAVWATERKASVHLTLNPVIDTAGPPGRALARSALLIMDPGPPPALVLRDPGSYVGRRIELASDAPTPEQMAGSLTAALRRPVRCRQTPMAAVRRGSADMGAMWDYLNETGYQVDIAALHRDYRDIPWTSFSSWAQHTFSPGSPGS
jgi:hypothetical protein